MSTVKMPCYCATLRQATRAVTSLYDERLRDAGIRSTQYTILQALKLIPNARNADLVDVLAIDQTTVTRTLSILHRRRLIKVTERPSRREKCWALTVAGEELYAAAQPLWELAQEDVRKRFGAERARALHSGAFDLASNLAS